MVCGKMKLQVNVGESKVMRRARNDEASGSSVGLNRESLEEVVFHEPGISRGEDWTSGSRGEE